MGTSIRQSTSRPRVYTRSNKSLIDYDVWRCFDRQLAIPTGKHKAVCKLTISPALLKQAFGTPSKATIGFAGTGRYDFEDTNLDAFSLFDYKKTTLQHGFNREDEFYTTEKNMKRSIKRRVQKWPSIEEFWNSEEPMEFRLVASEQADWRKFKRWLMNHLRKIEGSEFDYDKECLSVHEASLDICTGDFDKKGEVNTDMAIYKWTNTIFMSEEEAKAVPDEKKAVLKTPPKMFDLSKAKKVLVDKAELKIQEIQAEQEKLSQFI